VIRHYIVFFTILIAGINSAAQSQLEKDFLSPPPAAKPWVFWYWMHGAVSKQGITADLEAMKQVGIGGAYLMPIKDTVTPLLYTPAARQLSPEWWEMVRFAMQESKRLGLQLGMHVSDGFALAGGPWITPELSMQKLVWTKTYTTGNKKIRLPQPETIAGYYKDVAVFAYPANGPGNLIPVVTTSTGTNASFLAVPGAKESFKSDSTCWIQYQYEKPFTARSVQVHVGGNNYQAQRLLIQYSNDGVHFTDYGRLDPPRHGWQDTDEDVTNALPAITARYFRFVYNKEGSEPGAEDLDAAKWKPSFKIMGIYLSEEPVINQYESKNGSVWRLSKKENEKTAAVPSVINITNRMDKDGNLDWSPGPGSWIILRMGHTSTGHTNATGGAAKGLECDKFNAQAVALQFNNWFAQAFEKTDPVLASEVLKVFHVDSWECGSQNWSENFAAEFAKRRGYDLLPYLPVMAGVPVETAATAEKVLYDVRQTIAELVNDVFYSMLKKMSQEKGCLFSAESVAPTMLSDGMQHYQYVDLPMGEFWLNSPTHDKPNDMSDAISGAHVYGKKIIQAEAFTTLRMNWAEYPGMLKTLGDRNFAAGINKMVLHVFTHNPWTDRKPGMTLDGVGLYFQRDQTWFRQGKAWIDYLARCQAVLQTGIPVTDIAVFTGEELPRRSLLTDRLVKTLPGIFGADKVKEEIKRLTNAGQPIRQLPEGVYHSANVADPGKWVDALNGYAYDSFNPDALLRLATVKNGQIVLPGGASYALLVIPGEHPMQPDKGYMSVAVAKKILLLLEQGATLLMNDGYRYVYSKRDDADSLKQLMQKIFKPGKKGKLIPAFYTDFSFAKYGITKDLEIINQSHSIAWTHRRSASEDIFFIANQEDKKQSAELSFRITGRQAEIWDPVSGQIHAVQSEARNGRTIVKINLEANQSLFVIFRGAGKKTATSPAKINANKTIAIPTPWKVQFDTAFGGPGTLDFTELKSWTAVDDPAVKYYSGTALYSNRFFIEHKQPGKKAILTIDSIYNIATVKINGVDCGTLWTPPYQLDISKAIKNGTNEIRIEVANTWANRLNYDQSLPAEKRITQTTAPIRLKGKPLLPAGLVGKVTVRIE